ncbi:hypothetical protein QUF74_05575 [Candidatus Halobeggiatoa sp. HSG11]|nr:hypothetical protein [Candidatus Halobeggiatoa sp. HSG11]
MSKKHKISGELNIKRFYLPLKHDSQCPKCSTTNTHDFAFEPLHYPELNNEISIVICCENCNNDYEFKLLLELGVIIK